MREAICGEPNNILKKELKICAPSAQQRKENKYNDCFFSQTFDKRLLHTPLSNIYGWSSQCPLFMFVHAVSDLSKCTDTGMIWLSQKQTRIYDPMHCLSSFHLFSSSFDSKSEERSIIFV